MDDQKTRNFGETAKSLARNPLGVIALFIVLVYGLAAMITAFTFSFTPTERLPLIYFLIVFPVLVLGVFVWLVSRHNDKLFAPSDFKDENNYVKMMYVTAFLSAAKAKSGIPASADQLDRIVETVRAAGPPLVAGVGWKSHVLWVDDCPENNTYEKQAFERIGLQITEVQSTAEAVEKLEKSEYATIISDMGRKEGPREGYVLLDQLRNKGDNTPLVFYASSNSPEHKRETRDHGGQGCTNDAEELFEMVTRLIIRRETS